MFKALINSVVKENMFFKNHCQKENFWIERYDLTWLREWPPPLLGTGLLALMCADVLIEDGLLPEVFPALGTLVWLLTRMDSQVLIKYCPLTKRPFTVYACVRFLIGVDPQVLRQVRLLAESLTAFRTTVGSAIRVYPFMLEKGGFLFEVFTACEAFKEPQFPTQAVVGLF